MRERRAGLLEDLPGMAYRCRLDRTLLVISAGAEVLIGEHDADLQEGETRLTDLIHPDDRQRVEREIGVAVTSGRSFDVRYRLSLEPETTLWVRDAGKAILGKRGEEPVLVGFITRTEAPETGEERPARLRNGSLDGAAQLDSLTNLPSREHLMARLAMAMRRARRQPESSFALLSLDLDRFQLINDSLGYHHGNQVLLLISRRIAWCLRQEDMVAHLNGDRFVVLLEDIHHASDAIRVAQRIIELLALPLYLGSEEVFTSASVGIALGLSGHERPENLLRDAEIAMKRAKGLGGGRHQLFDRAMHHRAVARLRLETDLRHALPRQELRLVYQPIVDLRDGRIRGFEALVRWLHPERGLIGPTEFIPTATETGLIIPMTWWVLEKACAQLSAWHQLFPSQPSLFMSVNLTSPQFARTDLVQRIENTLGKHGLEADALHVEITEDVIMELAGAVEESLNGLDQLGVHLSLDDFGTGYSSLASLGELPLASVKIDRSFVSRLEERSQAVEIVRAIVNLAFNLGLEVVAEGVETERQADALLALGCRSAQGFRFARPIQPTEVEKLLTTQAPRAQLAQLA